MGDDLAKLVMVIFVCFAVLAYIAFLAWRVRMRRERSSTSTGPPVLGAPRPLTRAQRKVAAAAATASAPRPDLAAAEARVLAAAARIAGHEPPAPPAPPEADAAVEGPVAAAPVAPAPETPAPVEVPEAAPPVPSLFRARGETEPEPHPRAATVAELLSGIRLPEDLTPLTAMAHRPDVLDRVAFVATGPPAEVVAPAFAAELERLGFTTTPEGYDALVIERGPDRAMVQVHREAGKAYLDGQALFPATTPYAVVVEVWIPIEG